MVFLRLDKLDSSNDAADGEEEDQAGDSETHRCMNIILHKHELEVANETVDKGRD